MMSTSERLAAQGSFHRETINTILDEGFVCHVGFVVEGRPLVFPTNYARLGKRLLINASAVGRLIGANMQGIPMCVAVTLVDGLVLARSAFHHAINHRSVVIFAEATSLDDPADKMA